MFWKTVKSKEAMFAVVLMTRDAQLRNDIEGFCDNPCPHPTPKSNSLDRKLSKRNLKNGDKDAEVWLSTTEGFWRGRRWRRTQVSLRHWPPGV